MVLKDSTGMDTNASLKIKTAGMYNSYLNHKECKNVLTSKVSRYETRFVALRMLTFDTFRVTYYVFPATSQSFFKLNKQQLY